MTHITTDVPDETITKIAYLLGVEGAFPACPDRLNADGRSC
jgi:hypothetical protein